MFCSVLFGLTVKLFPQCTVIGRGHFTVIFRNIIRVLLVFVTKTLAFSIETNVFCARCVAKRKRFQALGPGVIHRRVFWIRAFKFLLKIIGSQVSVIQLKTKGINIETNTFIRVY